MKTLLGQLQCDCKQQTDFCLVFIDQIYIHHSSYLLDIIKGLSCGYSMKFLSCYTHCYQKRKKSLVA